MGILLLLVAGVGITLYALGAKHEESKRTPKKPYVPPKNPYVLPKNPYVPPPAKPFPIQVPGKGGEIVKTIMDNIAIGPFSALFGGNKFGDPTSEWYLFPAGGPSTIAGGVTPYRGQSYNPSSAGRLWHDKASRNESIPQWLIIYSNWESIRHANRGEPSVTASGAPFVPRSLAPDTPGRMLAKNWNDVRIAIAPSSWPVTWQGWFEADRPLMEAQQ